jgi:hypothetical protein
MLLLQNKSSITDKINKNKFCGDSGLVIPGNNAELIDLNYPKGKKTEYFKL